MKKISVLLLVLLLLLSFGGCGVLGEILGSETQPGETEDLSHVPEFLYEIADSLNLSMSIANGTQYGPYKVYEIPESIRLNKYTVVEEPNLSRYDRWMTIAAGNNRAKLTVYDGYRDLLCYESGETVLYYQDSDGKTLEKLRQDFDDVEFRAESKVSFVSSGDPSGPLREFASTAYPQFRMNLSEGSRYRFEEYDLMDYAVTEQTETMVAGEFSYYAKGNEIELPENAEPGSGKYEGWYYCTEEVRLELGPDGAWHLAEPENQDQTATDPTGATE